jgi:ABC-type dipeptide/oligopeptide/nickel transport system permease component
VVLLVTVITFGLLRMIPGNAAVAVMGPGAYRDPGAIKVFNADYGFNLPWYRQYLHQAARPGTSARPWRCAVLVTRWRG